MEKNLEYYIKCKTPPPEALKEIAAGRLKGFTDINPMWRIKVLTEMFGPCGKGWYYTIDKQWLEPGVGGDAAGFVNISLYVKFDNEWSKPIAGTGGSMFVALEKNGPRTSDEVFKMATTDAISVACKSLGVGADIYWDKDRTKYDLQGDIIDTPSPSNSTPKSETKPTPTPAKKQETKPSATAGNFPMCSFTTKYESSSMTDAQLEEILGYDLEHMELALKHWQSGYPKLKISYARLDRIKKAIEDLKSFDNNNPFPEDTIADSSTEYSGEELNDLPF